MPLGCERPARTSHGSSVNITMMLCCVTGREVRARHPRPQQSIFQGLDILFHKNTFVYIFFCIFTPESVRSRNLWMSLLKPEYKFYRNGHWNCRWACRLVCRAVGL